MQFFASCLAHQKWTTLFLGTNATSLLTKDILCFSKGLEKSLCSYLHIYLLENFKQNVTTAPNNSCSKGESYLPSQ